MRHQHRSVTAVNPQHAHVPIGAVAMIAGAVACFSLLDVIVKALATRHPIPFLVWARWGFQAIAMLIWLAPTMGLSMVRTQQLKMQLLRGVLLVVSSLFFVSALKYLPLADATALNYTTPTLVVLLAVVVLRERMTKARIGFVVAGAVGMLLIVQPGAEFFKGASFLALAAAVCYATYQIFTRMLAGEDPRVTLFYPALIGTLVMTLVWPWFGLPHAMTWTDVGWLALVGVLGTGGHFLFILAFARAPASALTPFTYLQLVWATLLGWIAFGDFPDGPTLAGMGIIGSTGLLLTWHERRRALIPPPEPPAVD